MTPTCKKCGTDMVFVYAVRVPSRDADVRVHRCLRCAETLAQTWVGGQFVGDGPMPLFAELRT